MVSWRDFVGSFADIVPFAPPVPLPAPPQPSRRKWARIPDSPMADPTDRVKNPVIHTFHDHPRFICASCSAVLALQDELISKSFSGRDGRGFLMHTAVNVKLGKKEDRPLLTGVHTVADVFCLGCNDRVGWYYHKASDHSQKYKEGKYLLEREKLVKENNWRLNE